MDNQNCIRMWGKFVLTYNQQTVSSYLVDGDIDFYTDEQFVNVFCTLITLINKVTPYRKDDILKYNILFGDPVYE